MEELGAVDEAPEDVFEGFGTVVDLFDELQAGCQLALAGLAAENAEE